MRCPPSIIAKYLKNYTTNDVYEILKDMGYIVKDTIGWKLTELGRANGGKMSKSNFPTPIFDPENIIDKMIEFWNNTHK
ncbi:MAG: hypothetical protein E7561_01075 [Ruminococcaceae bacterium]|nr:hypothetical protein [Oscillospiraceae bacterium]